MADGGKLPNHRQAGYISMPELTDPSHLVSPARDGYIAARVAELGNCFLPDRFLGLADMGSGGSAFRQSCRTALLLA